VNEFYEEKSLTKGMKEILDQLRKMYPGSRSYQEVLSSVLLEFQNMFYNKSTVVFSRYYIKKWSEQRKRWFNLPLPDELDWSLPSVEYRK
jgi:hypothetical protein